MICNESDRIALQLEPELRELFEAAALATGMTLSEFIRSAARVHAERLLAEASALNDRR